MDGWRSRANEYAYDKQEEREEDEKDKGGGPGEGGQAKGPEVPWPPAPRASGDIFWSFLGGLSG
eukprot:7754703-Pyramimonas_sp.AAC.1